MISNIIKKIYQQRFYLTGSKLDFGKQNLFHGEIRKLKKYILFVTNFSLANNYYSFPKSLNEKKLKIIIKGH